MWHANPVIDKALQALDQALLAELEAGRCAVAAWRVILLDGNRIETAGAGCTCDSCRALIAESAITFAECRGCTTEAGNGPFRRIAAACQEG